MTSPFADNMGSSSINENVAEKGVRAVALKPLKGSTSMQYVTADYNTTFNIFINRTLLGKSIKAMYKHVFMLTNINSDRGIPMYIQCELQNPTVM